MGLRLSKGVFYNSICKLSDVRLSFHCKLKSFFSNNSCSSCGYQQGDSTCQVELICSSLFDAISLCWENGNNSAICITENDFF
ncbi:hypothetical protein SAMN05216375_1265 [Trichococcus ilyis]|uniref:Uncharacterized protein n=1 Tax=Trichococcus ilyis TaxID=640938 RepID=A0A143Z6J3_9LACT|nr:Hypothetical protein TR210_2578 [Trichococcus ilyis]SEJ77221.1 hypothetical protein SAMN05216375_1265 [Trichococcus ilyis]